jgi:molybdopterin converting factor subunit 1
MTVHVKLFAVAKELAGCEILAVTLPNGGTVAELKRAVVEACPGLEALAHHAMWAVDTVYANDATIITEQSEIALIPPVSGG